MSIALENIPKSDIFKNPTSKISTSYRLRKSMINSKPSATLVFLHGVNGNSKSWAYQFEHFLSFDVLAVDAPGYGDSDCIVAGMPVIADELATLLTSLKIINPIIVGHSMGGMLAQVFASKHEHLCAALVLSCTHKGYGKQIDTPLDDKFTKRLKERKDMNNYDFGKIRVKKMLPNKISKKTHEFLSIIAGEMSLEGIKCSSMAIQYLDTSKYLEKLNVPTLIITSEKDIVVKETARDALERALPKASIKRLDGVGHAPYCEDPESFNKTIEHFIYDTLKVAG